MRSVVIAVALAACAAAGLAPVPAGGVSASPPAVAARVTGPERRGPLDTYVITSEYQESPCNLYVLRPRTFRRSKRYRVLYVLPAWAPSDDGIREVQKLGLADTYDVLCVQPEFSAMPWYADHPDNPKARNDSYLPEVIVPFIDRHYPTIARPEGRVLVGFSKSGLGAISLLLRHPDVFGRAGSWDAPLMEDKARPEYYGSQDTFMAYYYLPTLLAVQAPRLAGKPARLAVIGNGWGSTAQAHVLMEGLKIPHYADPSLPGAHEWTSGWLAPLVRVLMSPDMTRPTPPQERRTK